MTGSLISAGRAWRARASASALATVIGLAACGAPPAASVPPGPPAEQAPLGFTVKDLDGHEVRLADFKGRPLLINFWATYCVPCKTEIPAFVELVEKYKARQFTVLGISTDDPLSELKPFVAKYRINYPVLVGLGHDELMEAYEAQFSIPRTWFVRRDGTVAQKLVGPPPEGVNVRDWFDAQIQALF